LWILKKASIIIAPTKAHILFSKYSAQLSKKYKIIPFPVDDYLFELANNKLPRNLSNLSIDNPLKIISIGRLVSYKGFEYLIRSIPLILKQIPCRLDIVGDGPLKEKLIRLIESMDLHGKVFIHGALSKKSLHQLLSDSDLYCLPSITNAEMYGMVQYEAMAHGLPIIATEIPKSGVPVLIKDTSAGILVKPKLPNEIASGIIKIIFEPGLYNNLSIAGLNSIKNRFSQIRFVKEFEDAI
jgi:rhamnosyl/mannosyltransferase